MKQLEKLYKPHMLKPCNNDYDFIKYLFHICLHVDGLGKLVYVYQV